MRRKLSAKVATQIGARPTMFDRFKHLCLREELSDVDFVFNKGLSEETV